MNITTRSSLALLPLILMSVAACDSFSPAVTHPVDFAVTSARPPAAASGPLALNSLRLAVGGAALGSGDQFGCVDCNDDSEANVNPAIVDVSLDGAPTQVRTERVQPGTYTEAEIDVGGPSVAQLAADPAWVPGTSLEVTGTFAGQPFAIQLPIQGSFRERLLTPLVVGASGTPASAQVTITLPVAMWFTGPSGPLDPTAAADRALIEANIRGSFAALEVSRPEGNE